MIITVKSTQSDNSDANDFVNYFPDGLILAPNCEIGLLNITYNIQQGFAIEAGVNNHLEVSFPPYNVPQNVNISTGSYTWVELATEIQTQLRTVLTGMDILTRRLIPTATLTCTADAKAGTFLISSKWEPSDQDYQVSSVDGADPTGVITGDLAGGEGILYGYYRKTSTAETNASNFVTTGDWESYAFGKVNKSANPAYFHIAEYVVQDALTDSTLGLTINPALDASLASFGIETTGTGNFHIFEIIGGVRTVLNPPAGQRAWTGGDRFEIHMPVQTAAGPPVSPSYYHISGGTATLVDLSAAVGRGVVDPNADFFPIATIKEAASINTLDSEDDVMDDTGLLTTLGSTITTAGTGYLDGELVNITGGGAGATDASFYVTATGGAITGVLGWYDHGTGYGPGDVLTLTGSITGQSDARITVAGVDDAVGGSFGTLYVAGNVLNDTGTSGMVITVKTANAGGVITQFDITTPPTTYTLGTQITFTNPNAGGQSAILDFRALEDYYPTISGLKFRGLALNPTFHPLEQQQTQELGGSTLGPTIGIPNSTSSVGDTLTVQGVTVTQNNRTANNLLVHLDNFPIRSRHYLGEGRCVMALPFGDNTHASGLFQDRSYNLTYHALHNKEVVNHNEMRVRITDADGNKLVGIHHPVVLNFDLRPKII